METSIQSSEVTEHLAIVDKITQIVSTNQHPYAKLNEMVQGNIICAVNSAKETIGTANTVTVTATLGQEQEAISSTRTQQSLKQAKQLAAEDVLNSVVFILQSSTPRSFVQPTSRGYPPSKGELRQRSQDQTHMLEVSEICSTILNYWMLNIGIVSVDLEMWERDHTKNLEIGASFVAAVDLLDFSKFNTMHYVNTSNLHLQNHLKDLDQRDNFAFGDSILLATDDLRAEMEERMQSFIASYKITYLIGHSIHGDIAWLRQMGFTFMDSMKVIDIARVERWISNPTPYNVMSMEKIIQKLELSAESLHNAGNDARYGLEVLSRLAGIVASS